VHRMTPSRLLTTLLAATMLATACAPAGGPAPTAAPAQSVPKATEAPKPSAPTPTAVVAAKPTEAAKPAAQPTAAPQPAAAAPAKPGAPLEKVSVTLNWTLYGEHAFFFVARDKGFFAEQGLDVEIKEGSGSANTAKLVGAGTEPIGYVDTPTVMRAQAEGVPITTVLIVQQNGPSSVIHLAEKPLQTPKDLEGKRIALTAGDSFSAIFPAFLAANGVDQSKVEIVSLPTPAAKETALLQGQVDGFLGFFNDQPLRLMDREKVQIAWLPFFEHGVNVLSTGINVNQAYLTENPELVRKFLAGFVKGVDYTTKNVDEAAEIFAKAAPAFHKELSKQEIEQTIPLLQTANTKGQPLGCMSEKDYQDTYTLLVENANLKEGLDVKTMFSNEYLPAKCS
jgi:NitT/TauT family transport system substrate-binding protein